MMLFNGYLQGVTPLQVNLPWFNYENERAEDGQSTEPKQKTLAVHEADSN